MPENFNVTEELRKIKQLLDEGILTQEEFDIQKKKILYAENSENSSQNQQMSKTKFCKHCAEAIDFECIICPKCGKQVEELKQNSNTPINVNVSQNQSSVNTNTNRNINTYGPGSYRAPKNKWVALALCLFFGFIGAHKFYEGKGGMGLLYIFTVGLFGIGIFIDFIALLTKPNPYYV